MRMLLLSAPLVSHSLLIGKHLHSLHIPNTPYVSVVETFLRIVLLAVEMNWGKGFIADCTSLQMAREAAACPEGTMPTGMGSQQTW